MRLSIEMGKDFGRTVAQLSAMGQDIIEGCSAGLAKGVKVAAANVVRNHLSGQSLKTRSGHLKRAVDGWIEAPLDGVVGVHENSAVDRYKYLLGDESVTIKPKKGKFLAIPIGEGLTPSGVPRYSSPRDVQDGFFFKSRSGQLMFGHRKGKTNRARIRPLFVFKKQVTVKGSGALLAGVLDSADEIAEVMTDEISRRTD